MAKKALVVKANRKPKYKVRAYTRCQRCGRPRAVYRVFGLCRICVREMAHAGQLPAVTKSSWYPPHTGGRPPVNPTSPQALTGNRGEKGKTSDDHDRSDRGHA